MTKLRFSNKAGGVHQVVATKPGNFTPRYVSASEQVSKLVASDVKKILADKTEEAK